MSGDVLILTIGFVVVALGICASTVLCCLFNNFTAEELEQLMHKGKTSTEDE